MSRGGWWRAGCGVVVAMVCAGAVLLGAQEPAPGAEVPTPTLRVFTELVQVPVLVADDFLKPLRGVEASRFTVSLDSGPEFHPRNVRVEGDDPISVSILLDVGEAKGSMPARIAEAVAGMTPSGLHATDHVTVYAMGCGLFRGVQGMPVSPALLQHSVEGVLAREQNARETRGNCAQTAQLWDSVWTVVGAMEESKERRVLLVVTSGNDAGSKLRWTEATHAAQVEGVAVFGLTPFALRPVTPVEARTARDAVSPEDRFQLLCELSGGAVLHHDLGSLGKQLNHAVELVRERYIVEFARPRGEEVAGSSHAIVVKIAKSQAVVRPSGVSVSIQDAATMQNPTTIPRDLKDAPEMGKRKILKPSP